MADKPMNEIEQLEILLGRPEVFPVIVTDYVIGPDGTLTTTVNKHFVLIKQIEVGRIPELVKAAGSLMIYLTDKSKKLDVDQMLIYHPNESLELLALLCKLPRATVDKFELTDTTELLAKFVGVHMDFFVRKLLPLFSAVIRALQEEIKNPRLQALIGRAQLSSSSSTDTPST